MENVVLIIHLLLALSLIGVVLLQRSEGGGLGMGAAGVMTGRGQASALAKVTWALGAAFVVTSIALTIIAAQKAGVSSVVDRVSDVPEAQEQQALPPALEGDLLPPGAAENAPLVPQAGD